MHKNKTSKFDEMLKFLIRACGGEVKSQIRRFMGKRRVTYKDINLEISPSLIITRTIIFGYKVIAARIKNLIILQSFFSGNKIFVVDVGANIGLYTTFLGSVISPDSKILSFEPNEAMRERLKKNLQLNNINNVEVFPYAVGEKKEKLHLHFPSRWLPLSFFNSGEASLIPGKKQYKKSIEIEVVPLHDIVPETAKIDLIKIDVEGVEDKVLYPYLNNLSTEKLPRYILLEHIHTDNWTYDLLGKLDELGYEKDFSTGGNTLFNRE